MLSKKKLLLLILSTGAFLRFFNLTWGGGYYFHPDENNIAHSVLNLSWPKLDPQFYAYGQFSPYLTYFSAQSYNLFSFTHHQKNLSFSEVIFFLRFWSALSSTAIIYLTYLIGKKFFHFHSPFSLIPPFLTAFIPGLIQAAHFGTTESLLTFFFIAIIYFSLNFLKTNQKRNLLIIGTLSGLAIGTKISGAIFLITPLVTILIHSIVSAKVTNKTFFSKLKSAVILTSIIIIPTAFFTILSSPYLILKPDESFHILKYETNIAQGKIPIFYTRQFRHTVPYVFQIKKIFPYALGWPLFILGTIGFLLTTISLIKNLLKKDKIKNKLDIGYWILNIGFLVYFLYNGQLFVKWTRFMAPLFPFFALFATYGLKKIYHYLSQKISSPTILHALYFILLLLSILPGTLFLTYVYAQPDIRLTASKWIYQNIPKNSIILSEAGNVINLPISNIQTQKKYLKVINFDFYNLDKDPQLQKQLVSILEQANYIIIPSRRIFTNHLHSPHQYPLTAKYYQSLFSGQLGFKKIKQFNFYSRLPIFGDELAEETWSIFDHPVIRIYQKTVPYSPNQYNNLLLGSPTY